jgi:hypothetical protein
MFNAPVLENEISLRTQLTQSPFNTCAIIVVDEIPTSKITLFLETKTYDDVREKIVKLNAIGII